MPLQPTKPTGPKQAVPNDNNNNNKGKRKLTNPNNNNNNKTSKPSANVVHKKPTLEDTIEHVFTVLRDQSELENGIPVPPKFFYFYDSEMLRHFLACVVYYFYAFTQVKDLESDLINSPSDERTKLQLHESRKALQQRLRIFAEAYSRLLLHCSNFEHTQEDQSFFEFLFEFTRTTCRMAVAEEQWDSIDEALGHVFRGYMFNTDALRSPRADNNNNKNKRNNGLLSGNNGNGGNNNNNNSNGSNNNNGFDDNDVMMIHNNDDDDTKNNNNGNNDIDGDGTIINKPDEVKMILKRYARKKNDDFFKVANRLQSNTAEAEKAINLAKKLLASHKHKVTRVPRAKSVRGKHNKIVKMTKLSQLNEKRLGLSANLPTERARDFSIRKTFNTRSPMISLLLPTPAERLEVSMMHYEHKKKMQLKKMKKQRQRRGNSIKMNNNKKKGNGGIRLPSTTILRGRQRGVLSGGV